MIGRPGALFAFGIVLALGAAACGTSSNTSTSGSGITFAAPVSQTGAFGQAEGLYTLQGYKFCVQTLNAKGGIQYGGQSHQVTLVTQDDQSVSATSAQIVDQYNDKSYKLILSPYGSPATTAVAPVVESDHGYRGRVTEITLDALLEAPAVHHAPAPLTGRGATIYLSIPLRRVLTDEGASISAPE